MLLLVSPARCSRSSATPRACIYSACRSFGLRVAQHMANMLSSPSPEGLAGRGNEIPKKENKFSFEVDPNSGFLDGDFSRAAPDGWGAGFCVIAPNVLSTPSPEGAAGCGRPMPKRENKFSFEVDPNNLFFDVDCFSAGRPPGSTRAGFCVTAPCIADQTPSHTIIPRRIAWSGLTDANQGKLE